MPISELKEAVNYVVSLIEDTELLSAISDFRTDVAKNKKTPSKDNFLIAGKKVANALAQPSPLQQRVVRHLHLEQLASVDYWDSLANVVKGPAASRAELVQLYSRVLFASNHLPGFVHMLATDSNTDDAEKVSSKNLLKIRLLDAGERAGDPDRISRTIDGVDMVYSACVSLSKKPAQDLILQSIVGDAEKHLIFEGDEDGLNAVREVIDSMVDEIALISDPEDFDPDELVTNLQVFEDLKTLEGLGTFRRPEAKEIEESMHEGCLLLMESGVMLEPKADAIPVVHKSDKVIPLPLPVQSDAKSQPVEQTSTVESFPQAERPESEAYVQQAENTDAFSDNHPVREGELILAEDDVAPTVTLKAATSVNDIEEAAEEPATPIDEASRSAASASAGTQVKLGESAAAVLANSEDELKDISNMSPKEFYLQYLQEKKKMESSSDESNSRLEEQAKKLDDVENSPKNSDVLNDLILDLDRITGK